MDNTSIASTNQGAGRGRNSSNAVPGQQQLDVLPTEQPNTTAAALYINLPLVNASEQYHSCISQRCSRQIHHCVSTKECSDNFAFLFSTRTGLFGFGDTDLPAIRGSPIISCILTDCEGQLEAFRGEAQTCVETSCPVFYNAPGARPDVPRNVFPMMNALQASTTEALALMMCSVVKCDPPRRPSSAVEVGRGAGANLAAPGLEIDEQCPQCAADRASCYEDPGCATYAEYLYRLVAISTDKELNINTLSDLLPNTLLENGIAARYGSCLLDSCRGRASETTAPAATTSTSFERDEHCQECEALLKDCKGVEPKVCKKAAGLSKPEKDGYLELIRHVATELPIGLSLDPIVLPPLFDELTAKCSQVAPAATGGNGDSDVPDPPDTKKSCIVPLNISIMLSRSGCAGMATPAEARNRSAEAACASKCMPLLLPCANDGTCADDVKMFLPELFAVGPEITLGRGRCGEKVNRPSGVHPAFVDYADCVCYECMQPSGEKCQGAATASAGAPIATATETTTSPRASKDLVATGAAIDSAAAGRNATSSTMASGATARADGKEHAGRAGGDGSARPTATFSTSTTAQARKTMGLRVAAIVALLCVVIIVPTMVAVARWYKRRLVAHIAYPSGESGASGSEISEGSLRALDPIEAGDHGTIHSLQSIENVYIERERALGIVNMRGLRRGAGSAAAIAEHYGIRLMPMFVEHEINNRLVAENYNQSTLAPAALGRDGAYGSPIPNYPPPEGGAQEPQESQPPNCISLGKLAQCH